MTTILITNEESRQAAADFISKLAADRAWDVEVKRHVKRRTRSQDGLYFKWLGEVAKHVSEHTGYEKDEIHAYLKERFMEPKIIEIDGYVAKRYSITDCDTKAMSEYMDRIYRWAQSDLGIVLPLPPVMTEER